MGGECDMQGKEVTVYQFLWGKPEVKEQLRRL